MSSLKYDYAKERHIVDALGGLEALEAVKAQVEGLELPDCPFCGGEAVVALGAAYGQPTVRVECDQCHASAVLCTPGYNFLTRVTTDMHDAVNDAARRWSRRKEHIA